MFKAIGAKINTQEIEYGLPSWANLPVTIAKDIGNMVWVKLGYLNNLLRTNEKYITFTGCFCSMFEKCWIFTNTTVAIEELSPHYKSCATYLDANFEIPKLKKIK